MTSTGRALYICTKIRHVYRVWCTQIKPMSWSKASSVSSHCPPWLFLSHDDLRISFPNWSDYHPNMTSNCPSSPHIFSLATTTSVTPDIVLHTSWLYTHLLLTIAQCTFTLVVNPLHNFFMAQMNQHCTATLEDWYEEWKHLSLSCSIFMFKIDWIVNSYLVPQSNNKFFYSRNVTSNWHLLSKDRIFRVELSCA